jgi:hypothetical protein
MTLSGTVVLLIGAVAAVRVAVHFWPRLFPRSTTSQILLGLEANRTSRHTDVDLLSAYHRFRSTNPDPDALPDRTWRDLDLDDVFATIDHAESEPGRQYLNHLLRTPTQSRERLAKLERAVDRFASDAATADRARRALRRLRDRRAARLAHLLFEDLPARPRGWWLFPGLTATSLLCLALIPVWPRSLIVWLGVCVANVAVQVFYKPRVKEFVPAIHELPAFLNAADALGELSADELSEEAERLRGAARRFTVLRRASMWLMFEPGQGNAEIASLFEYLNMLFLLDVNAFVFAIGTIRGSNTALRRLFEAIGYLDAALSIAKWRSTLPHWSRPDFTDPDESLDVVDVVHPLLEAPVANSLCVTQSVLITGSNMSGKTTFVRTLGVNAVLAQSLHTVCAAQWRAPLLRVRASIGRADSIMEGKSYYLAEVESVLTLVRAKESGVQHLFLLDEIFRGTNTTERVAAAYAVLAYLDRGDDIVIVATHDLEVLDLMNGSYAARHFREQIENNGLVFDYAIQDGPSSTRNAIALLKFMKYPDDLIADALNNLDWIERRVADIP